MVAACPSGVNSCKRTTMGTYRFAWQDLRNMTTLLGDDGMTMHIVSNTS